MTAAVLDACVLYSAMLRDLFMRLAVGSVFQPKWTAQIHEEWIRNVLRNRMALKNPSRSPDDYLERLIENGLHQTAARLKVFQKQIQWPGFLLDFKPARSPRTRYNKVDIVQRKHSKRPGSVPMPVAEKTTADHKKLKELILYIAVASEGDEAFGSIKLNKLLFFSDFLFYMMTEKAITGEEYQKLKNGPAPRVLLPVSEEMRKAREMELADRKHYGKPQKRPVALREPDLSVFTAEEIAVVDQVLRFFRDKNGSEISSTSHQFLGWQLANEGDTIPYVSSSFYTRDLTHQEMEWANDLDLAGAEEMLR